MTDIFEKQDRDPGQSDRSFGSLSKIRISATIFCLVLTLTGCTKYHPPLLISYTQDGQEISIKKLTEGSSPSWSPDGKKIAFQEYGGIWILDLETETRDHIAPAGTNPAWSPDGNRIAYANQGIWIWDKGSNKHTRLNKEGDHPCWFPEGDQLAFSQNGIWLADINGSKKRRLFDEGIPLSFAPDGASLLIEMMNKENVYFILSILKLSNLEAKYLVEGTKGSFAPDGYSIVYSMDGIWIYSLIKKLSTGIILDGYDPKWSPAGDHIVFSSQGGIWIIDAPYRAINSSKETTR
jgi:Tol biopolymer transport system component